MISVHSNGVSGEVYLAACIFIASHWLNHPFRVFLSPEVSGLLLCSVISSCDQGMSL